VAPEITVCSFSVCRHQWLSQLKEFRNSLSAVDREHFSFLEDDRLGGGPGDCFLLTDDHRSVLAFGHLTYFPGETKKHVARLGVAVRPNSRRQGWAEDLCRRMVEHARSLSLHKIWLSVHSENHAAIALYDKLGFTVEGVFTDEEITSVGEYRDVLSMSCFLREEDSPSKHIAWCEPDWGEGTAAGIKVLSSGWLTQGRKVRELEDRLQHMFENRAVCVSSGTMALLLMAQVAKMQGCKRVVLPALSFAATAAPLLFLGLEPLYVDVDLDTALMDREQADFLLTRYEDAGLLAVHIGGAHVDRGWLQKHYESGRFVWEDAAQAVDLCLRPEDKGGSLRAALSFHAAKTITTIEGGAVIGPESLVSLVQSLRQHGESVAHQRYWAFTAGLNGRMTDVQAAMGLSQLDSLADRVLKRERIWERYRQRLWNTAVVQKIDNGSASLALVRFPDSASRGRVEDALAMAGVETRPVWPPLNWQFGQGDERELPNAAAWHYNGLLLPMSTRMDIPDVDYICDKIVEVV